VHELSLADSIVRVARDHARGRRVMRVEVQAGALRQVVPEALEFAFVLLSRDTELEGAALAIEHVPVRVRCSACGAETECPQFPLLCGNCGRDDTEVVAGEELLVDALEFDDGPVPAGRR
jgi:hydrogenase nickel incorporation protein HypA/HybF